MVLEIKLKIVRLLMEMLTNNLKLLNILILYILLHRLRQGETLVQLNHHLRLHRLLQENLLYLLDHHLKLHKKFRLQ
tara:strand:+ start:228 stop:458 length:231 start_codon:yes stop_codon:yes gene_type:complete